MLKVNRTMVTNRTEKNREKKHKTKTNSNLPWKRFQSNFCCFCLLSMAPEHYYFMMALQWPRWCNKIIEKNEYLKQEFISLAYFTWTLHEKCKLFLLRVVRLMETAWHGNNRECAGKWDIHGNLLLFVHCHLFLSRYATQSCWHSTEINYVWLSRFLDSEFSVELSKILSIDLFRWAQNSK